MEMAMIPALVTCFYMISLHLHRSFSSSSRPPLGVHPLDFKYYDAELIQCKDGSKSFTTDRLNDDFCDCVDGTDEPDCCDGSDEYDGTFKCPNTCMMGGNIVYQGISHERASDLDSVNSRKTKPGTEMEDSTNKLKGLKALVFVQLALVIVFISFRLFRRCKTRRRNSR